eukprot:SAG31_NODE_1628_length_7704_cov_27.599606_2_plen_43_part_00
MMKSVVGAIVSLNMNLEGKRFIVATVITKLDGYAETRGSIRR